MNQEQFMINYFPEHLTVSVNANELQELIRANRKLEDSNEALRYSLEDLEFEVKYLNQLIDDSLNKQFTVKLDIKG